MCLTLCDPMDCSTPGLVVPHHLPKFAQVNVHYIIDAVQPSHPLMPSSPSLFALGTFPMSCLFTSDDENLGASGAASFLPVNIQGWSPLRLTDLISLLSKGLSRIFSNTTVQKHQFFQWLAFFKVQLSYSYMITGKTIALTIWTFVGRVMSLLFNTLFRFVIPFLPRKILILKDYFWFHGCNHCPQWSWRARRGNLSLHLPFPLPFTMK